jgi:hypothetical protein
MREAVELSLSKLTPGTSPPSSRFGDADQRQLFYRGELR